MEQRLKSQWNLKNTKRRAEKCLWYLPLSFFYSFFPSLVRLLDTAIATYFQIIRQKHMDFSIKYAKS